jgi:hypothetical protein
LKRNKSGMFVSARTRRFRHTVWGAAGLSAALVAGTFTGVAAVGTGVAVAEQPAPPVPDPVYDNGTNTAPPSQASLTPDANGELVALRTAYSDTYVQADGSRRVSIADQPINFRTRWGVSDGLCKGRCLILA